MKSPWNRRLAELTLAALLSAGLIQGAMARPQGGDPDCRHEMNGPRGPQDDGHTGHHEGMGPGMHLYRGLQLTRAQEDKLFEMQHAQMPKARERMMAARSAADELHKLGASGNFDAAKAKSLAQNHAQAMTDLMVMRAEFESKARALLTPEQRKALDEKLAQREKDRDTRHPMGMEGRPPR